MKTILSNLCIIIACATAWSGNAADVAALWDKNCASCHAKDGSGNTKMGKKLEAKDYRDPKVQAELKDDKAIKAIKEGINEKGKERMKAFTEKLTEDEIKALVAYMRTFKPAN